MATICWDCVNGGKCYEHNRTKPCEKYYNTFKSMEENVKFKDGECEEYGYCVGSRCKYYKECDGI